jgi:hypothetical protein
MKRTMILSCLAMAFASTSALAQNTQQELSVADLQKQLQEMRSQMDSMRTRINELESAKAKPAGESANTGPLQQNELPQSGGPEAPAPPPEKPSPHLGDATVAYESLSEDSVAAPRYDNAPLDPKYHGYFRLPGTQTLLKIGGYFKTDFIYDLKPAGNTDEFIPSSIPIPSVHGVDNANVSIRPTRLSFDFRIPNSRAGDVRFYLEGDLFGTTSTTPRLRHAYAQVDNFLVGQTFTNFMDPDASPDTLDFEGPNGWVNLRNPQFRYTLAVAKRTIVSVSVEKPSSDIAFKTPQFSSQPNSPSPDGTVRVRQEFDRGHVQVASVFRSIAAYLPNGLSDSVFGWGVNGSGAIRVLRRDNIIIEGTHGQGISRYIEDASGLGIDAAVISRAQPHLRATAATAAEGAYQHYWNRAVRSNLVYGYVQVENTLFQPATTFHKSNYASGNLIWNAVGSLNVGAELLYGWQEQKGGARASAPRIQLTAKYSFVKIDRDEK